jgi:hypothetical protein
MDGRDVAVLGQSLDVVFDLPTSSQTTPLHSPIFTSWDSGRSLLLLQLVVL